MIWIPRGISKSSRKNGGMLLRRLPRMPAVSRDSIKLILEVGNPIDELLKIIIDENVDLVVMGVKGRTDLEHILIGSVAEKLFRRSPVTVISYRDEKNRQRLRKRINLT